MWNLLHTKGSLKCDCTTRGWTKSKSWSLIVSIILFVVTMRLMTPALAATAEPYYPLEPPDTSSPRATLQSFLSYMKEAQRFYLEAKRASLKEKGLYPSQES